MKRKERMILFGLIVAGILVSFISEKEEKTNPKDYTERAFGISLEMVYVEGGTFRMGATDEQGDDEWELSNEYPVRSVTLNSYYIGKYEVTEAQWKAVMGSPPWGDSYPKGVSWYAAQAFCKKLSEATGKKYVLPTEAQWEYAARGGNKSRSYKYAGGNNIKKVAWYKENKSRRNACKVGRKKANELGIYDMSGNTWEWCSDWYDAYDKEDTDNPQGAAEGSCRVVRGGSWDDDAEDCRVSSRFWFSPEDIYRPNHGFRVACLSE